MTAKITDIFLVSESVAKDKVYFLAVREKGERGNPGLFVFGGCWGNAVPATSNHDGAVDNGKSEASEGGCPNILRDDPRPLPSERKKTVTELSR